MLRIFMLFLILFSCNNINNRANDNIIPADMFTDLIADIHLIEAKFETIKFKESLKLLPFCNMTMIRFFQCIMCPILILKIHWNFTLYLMMNLKKYTQMLLKK